MQQYCIREEKRCQVLLLVGGRWCVGVVACGREREGVGCREGSKEGVIVLYCYDSNANGLIARVVQSPVYIKKCSGYCFCQPALSSQVCTYIG